MQCKDLEFVLESEGLGTLSAEAREHLAECGSCQGLLADLHSIVAVAGTLHPEVEPPARVWTAIQAQLEAEGLIKQPVEVPQAAPWWESLRAAFSIRSLGMAAAGLALVVATLVLTHKPSSTPSPVAAQRPSAEETQTQKESLPSPATQTESTLVSTPGTAAPKTHAPAPAPSRRKLAPSPSETASSTLAQAELSMPDMQLAGNSTADASFRQNLHTLNQFIAECERHLRQNPQDELAREYLNMAYQQKADLLAAMMENGRSEH